jgi:cysteine desulfurase/selenocysteine lyase
VTPTAMAQAPAASGVHSLDVAKIRKDFPILSREVYGRPLVYLDNAATTQKPQAVIDAISHYYAFGNSNIHRGVHLLSQTATDAYEEARETVQRFLGAEHSSEIIFVRGATEAINLVAQSFGRQKIGPGDEVLITAMEHHANIVPWQMLCEEKGATLRIAPINDEGELELEAFEALLNPRTKIAAITHVSNALGTINPVERMIAMAHAKGVPVLVDGAQAVAHLKVDVRALKADFYVFSGHKVYGPTGVGVLYGRRDLLNAMPPYQGGGDMIRSVTFEKTIYNQLPYKFEAGTPHISGAIGLKAAIDYVEAVGLGAIAQHEHALLEYGTQVLRGIPKLRLIGTAAHKASVLSFVMEDIHPHDIGTVLDREGIAIRTGHHCAQPLMHRFQVAATARASLAMYNTREELDALGAGLQRLREVFA